MISIGKKIYYVTVEFSHGFKLPLKVRDTIFHNIWRNIQTKIETLSFDSIIQRIKHDQ
jgi:hypothetical protein